MSSEPLEAPGRVRGLMAVRVRPRRPAPAAAVAVLAALALLAVLAPLFTSLDPVDTDTSATSLPTGSPGHPLGTDLLGRDLWTRMLYGARTSLLVGLTTAAITVGLGMLAGGLAAIAPRWLDGLIARAAQPPRTPPRPRRLRTSGLDVLTQERVLRLLADLRRDHGLTIVLVTHDLRVARRVADRVIVLHDGRIAEDLPATDLDDARHPATRLLLEASDLHPATR